MFTLPAPGRQGIGCQLFPKFLSLRSVRENRISRIFARYTTGVIDTSGLAGIRRGYLAAQVTPAVPVVGNSPAGQALKKEFVAASLMRR